MERRSSVARNIQKQIASFTLFITTLSYTAPPINLQAIVTTLHTCQAHERQQYQNALLHYLHKKNTLKPNYTDTLNALLLDNSLPFLTEHAQTLVKAITLFKDVQGFGDTFFTLLSHAHSPHTAAGFLYELEVAIAKQEKGERVTAFGKRHQSKTERRDREIDVETKDHWLECKNINWQTIHKQEQKEHLKHQLLDENKLAFEHNQHTKKQKTFTLCSKKPIPLEWQTWLNEQAIDYCCTSDEENSASSSSSEQE